MLNRFMEKLLESATTTYLPKFEEMAKTKAVELAVMKDKIRTNPEEVELWFDNEIKKISNVDIKNLIGEVLTEGGKE
jgi:hypothetical protein